MLLPEKRAAAPAEFANLRKSLRFMFNSLFGSEKEQVLKGLA
jgi:hypothetical protein